METEIPPYVRGATKSTALPRFSTISLIIIPSVVWVKKVPFKFGIFWQFVTVYVKYVLIFEKVLKLLLEAEFYGNFGTKMPTNVKQTKKQNSTLITHFYFSLLLVSWIVFRCICWIVFGRTRWYAPSPLRGLIPRGASRLRRYSLRVTLMILLYLRIRCYWNVMNFNNSCHFHHFYWIIVWKI